MKKKLLSLAMVGVLSILALGCEKNEKDAINVGATNSKPKEITLVTTTSLEDTGFLEETLKKFEEENNVDVKVVAKGTGEALELGKRKDADILFVHAKDKEEAFINEGYGVDRTEIMYNYFVVVGPEENEHNIEIGSLSVEDGFKYIKENNLNFISRGDNSGTHTKELAIWKKAEIENEFENYKEVGKGMAATLQMASEMEAYTLTDIGTYLASKGNIKLGIVKEADETLKNVYSIVRITELDEETQEITDKLLEYYKSEETQKAIKEYGKEKYGQPLFYTF